MWFETMKYSNIFLQFSLLFFLPLETVYTTPMLDRPMEDLLYKSDMSIRIPSSIFRSSDNSSIFMQASGLPSWIDMSFLSSRVSSFPSFAVDVKYYRGYLYVLGNDQIHIVDITNRNNPILIGIHNCSVASHYFFVQDEFVYVAEKFDGMKIFNVTNKNSPVVVSSFPVCGGDYIEGIFTQGNFAYICCQHGGFKIVNISDKSNVSVLGSVNTNYSIIADCVGEYCYIADYHYGLRIVNVSNPNDPVLVGKMPATQSTDVAVGGDYCYIARHGSDMLIISNVSDKSNPTLVGQVQSNDCQAIVVVGNLAFCTGGSAFAVSIFDVVDKTNPRLLVSIPNDPYTEYGRRISVYENTVFVANGLPSQLTGMVVIEFGDLEIKSIGYKEVDCGRNESIVITATDRSLDSANDTFQIYYINTCTSYRGEILARQCNYDFYNCSCLPDFFGMECQYFDCYGILYDFYKHQTIDVGNISAVIAPPDILSTHFWVRQAVDSSVLCEEGTADSFFLRVHEWDKVSNRLYFQLCLKDEDNMCLWVDKSEGRIDDIEIGAIDFEDSLFYINLGNYSLECRGSNSFRIGSKTGQNLYVRHSGWKLYIHSIFGPWYDFCWNFEFGEEMIFKDLYNTDVCSNHGDCVDPDRCECGENYYGDYCNITICHGLYSNESYDVCSGKGNCKVYEKCECFQNYIGEYCNITLCDQRLSNITSTCTEYGTCWPYNICQCDRGYFGEGCNVSTCFGVYSNTSAICSEHGVCWPEDTCKCSVITEYFGSDCNYTYCNGNPTDTIGVCSDRGSCWPFEQCNCFQNYYGEDCNITTCGEYYSNETEFVCSKHGICGPVFDQCNCDIIDDKYKYYGSNCDIFTCGGVFTNESSRLCSGHGECINPDHCICAENYFGKFCEVNLCWTHLSNESACNDHGKCVNHNRCECQGWSGDQCEFTVCFGLPANETSQVCSGHGVCEIRDTCQCDQNYYGIFCNTTTCGNYFSNQTSNKSSQVCNGHGECYQHEKCTCTAYAGDYCQFPVCFGYDSEEEPVCNFGNGQCIFPDDCDCLEGFYGGQCLDLIKNPRFESGMNYRVIKVDYMIPADRFLISQKGNMLNADGFNCSKIIRNWKDFLSYNSSWCKFKSIIFVGIKVSELLSIEILNEWEYKNEKELNNEFSLSNNVTLEIITISDDDVVRIELYEHPIIVNPSQEKDDNKEKSGSGDSFTQFLPLLISSSSVFLLCVILFFCLVFFFIPLVICFLFITFLICFLSGGSIFGCVYLKQTRRLSLFGRLDNFDMLLKEQLIEKDISTAHLKINKDLFQIPIDEIDIIENIGEGGSQSIVFKARWKSNIVAFKCFRTRMLISSQDSFSEFEKEVEILASLSHPNIIRFFGATLKPPRVGIIMEYCENGDLENFLCEFNSQNEHSFPLKEKVRMTQEIVLACEFIHSRSIIHRDLKLENVLVDSQMSCKLMDFGLSKMVEKMSKKKTKKIGTNVYMAPEICKGGDYNEKLDVFSFGILVWILFTEESNPYGVNTSTPISYEFRVASDPCFRPSIETVEGVIVGSQYQWILEIIQTSWSHDAADRWSFSEIGKFMRRKLK